MGVTLANFNFTYGQFEINLRKRKKISLLTIVYQNFQSTMVIEKKSTFFSYWTDTN